MDAKATLEDFLHFEDFHRLVANLQLLRAGNLRPDITNIGNTNSSGRGKSFWRSDR